VTVQAEPRRTFQILRYKLPQWRHIDSRELSCYGKAVLSANDIDSRRVLIPVLLCLLVLLINALAARAMVVLKRDFPDLVTRSEQIVIGTVTGIREEQDSSGTPYTLVTFSDLSVLKGEVGSALTLRFYGGTAGDVQVRISDMPTFTIGERDVLFVAGNGSTVCPLVGVWQGRFYVRFDADLGTDIVEDSNHQLLLLGLNQRELIRAPARGAREGDAAAGGQPPLTLDDFRQLIADALAQPQPNN